MAELVRRRKMPDFDAQSYLTAASARMQGLLEQKGTMRIAQLRQEFQDCMSQHCGVFRTATTLELGLAKVQQLKQRYKDIYLDDKGTCWNTELIEAIELQNLMIVGEIILTGALNRRESRGAHDRDDYSARDDASFLQHTLAYYTPTGVDLDFMPVVINRFEPQERKY